MQEISVPTHSRTEFVDITAEVQRVVSASGVDDGICTVFVPHTTAAVTINENADPSVCRDMLAELNKVIPFDDGYTHSEGNSAAHIKSTLVGCSEQIIIANGALVLGTWQGVYFCEFDGPRSRQVHIKIVG